MNIFCISDIHGAMDCINKVAELMKQADLIIIAGDITQSRRQTEAQNIIDAIERLNPHILAVHGNWDRPEVRDFLDSKGHGLHERGVIINGIGFFGVGGSSPTPMQTATEYSEEDLSVILEKGYSLVKQADKIVLVSHCPPRGVLDRTHHGLSGGSMAIKSFLELHHIDLCICGHIHEAAGAVQLQGTLVVNCGSLKRGSCLMIKIGKVVQITQNLLAG
jgi:putative phosphoesterase